MQLIIYLLARINCHLSTSHTLMMGDFLCFVVFLRENTISCLNFTHKLHGRCYFSPFKFDLPKSLFFLENRQTVSKSVMADDGTPAASIIIHHHHLSLHKKSSLSSSREILILFLTNILLL